jgi:hypothetical protein
MESGAATGTRSDGDNRLFKIPPISLKCLSIQERLEINFVGIG